MCTPTSDPAPVAKHLRLQHTHARCTHANIYIIMNCINHRSAEHDEKRLGESFHPHRLVSVCLRVRYCSPVNIIQNIQTRFDGENKKYTSLILYYTCDLRIDNMWLVYDGI